MPLKSSLRDKTEHKSKDLIKFEFGKEGDFKFIESGDWKPNISFEGWKKRVYFEGVKPEYGDKVDKGLIKKF